MVMWCCQVLLALLPGDAGVAPFDDEGLQALALLRQLGMPALIGVASGGAPDQATNAAARMKAKAAARKRAAAALASEVIILQKGASCYFKPPIASIAAACKVPLLLLCKVRLQPAIPVSGHPCIWLSVCRVLLKK